MTRYADPELWTPARFVATPQRCHLCGEHIPRCSPGATTGTRGTKAFFNAALSGSDSALKAMLVRAVRPYVDDATEAEAIAERVMRGE